MKFKNYYSYRAKKSKTGILYSPHLLSGMYNVTGSVYKESLLCPSFLLQNDAPWHRKITGDIDLNSYEAGQELK